MKAVPMPSSCYRPNFDPAWETQEQIYARRCKIVITCLAMAALTLFILGATQVYDISELKWTMLGTFHFLVLTLFFHSLCGGSSAQSVDRAAIERTKQNLPKTTRVTINTPLPGLPHVTAEPKTKIFSFLRGQEILRLLRVSKEWRSILQTEELWKTYCFRERFIASHQTPESYYEHYKQVAANGIFATPFCSVPKIKEITSHINNYYKNVDNHFFCGTAKSTALFEPESMRWKEFPTYTWCERIFNETIISSDTSRITIMNRHNSTVVAERSIGYSSERRVTRSSNNHYICVTRDEIRKRDKIREYDNSLSLLHKQSISLLPGVDIVCLQLFEHTQFDGELLLIVSANYGMSCIQVYQKQEKNWVVLKTHSIKNNADWFYFHKKTCQLMYKSRCMLFSLDIFSGEITQKMKEYVYQISSIGDTLIGAHSNNKLLIWNINNFEQPIARIPQINFSVKNIVINQNQIGLVGYNNTIRFYDFTPL